MYKLRKGFGAFLGLALAGSAFALAAPPIGATALSDLTLAYLANFANGSLGGSVDKLGLGTLVQGDSLVAGSDPTWAYARGEYRISITRPSAAPAGPVSAGVFATPVDFPAGSVVGLRGTFIGPVGPHASTDIWAVTINAKTGDERDLAADKRISATFQVRGESARLNTPGAATPANLPDIPQELYDEIFDPRNPQPFTLELVINRDTGESAASFKFRNTVISKNFQAAQFPADDGPAITTVGTAIAIARGSDVSASVRVRSFEIFIPKGQCTQNQKVC